MQYKNFFKSELKNLKDQGLYRDFRNIDRPIRSFPNADESFDIDKISELVIVKSFSLITDLISNFFNNCFCSDLN